MSTEQNLVADIQAGAIVGMETALEIVKRCKSQENAIQTLEEFILKERIKNNGDFYEH